VQQEDEPNELMLRYLSGDLSEDARKRIEERFFADPQYFEGMLAAEDALIDDFVRGTLSEGDHENLDRFLKSSPYELQEIEFVKDLIRNLSKAHSPVSDESTVTADRYRSKLRLFALSKLAFRSKLLRFAALILGIFSITIVIWNLALQRKIAGIEARRIVLEQREQQLKEQVIQRDEENLSLESKLENERSFRGQLERELDNVTQRIPSIPRTAAVSILLTTEAITRGAAHAPTVHIRPETRLLRIEIELESSDNHKNYGAVIKTFDGRRVWGADQIRRDQSIAQRCVLMLPARIFPSDDYILTLSGQNDSDNSVDVRDYSFHVRR
jgi:hypothetical protein